MSVNDIVNVIETIMDENREKLSRKGNNKIYQIFGEVNNEKYVLGVTKGRVGQLYPSH